MKQSQTTIQVRYAETDQMGIAHHSNYAVWFEQARTELTAGIGMHYRDLEAMGLMLPLTDLSCHYRLPALYEDTLVIQTGITFLSDARVTFGYRVMKGETVICTGETRHAFVGRDMRPVNLKKRFPEVFRALSEFLPEEENKEE